MENVKVHPPARARVNFRTVFAWWLRFGGIFRRSLRGRRLKKINFLGKKCTPDKILATPMAVGQTEMRDDEITYKS